MNESIDALRRDFESDLAAINGMDAWKAIRDKYLSRDNGAITAELKKLREIPKEERPAFGQAGPAQR